MQNNICDTIRELQKQAATLENNTEAEQEAQLREEEFASQHAPITVAFHQELKSHVIQQSYLLPNEGVATAVSYSSRYECEKAAEKVIRKAYDLAERYVTPGDSKSVSKTVAAEYAEVIQSVFRANQDLLRSCCQSLGHMKLYDELMRLVNNSEKNLRSVLDEELMDSSDYYKMYRFDYFMDKIEIEEMDCRIAENEILRLMEALFTDNIQYSYRGTWSAISEIEKDLNEHLKTFYHEAYTEYQNYLKKIETLLDALDADFMAQQQQKEKEKPESAIEKALKNMMKPENESAKKEETPVCSRRADDPDCEDQKGESPCGGVPTM